MKPLHGFGVVLWHAVTPSVHGSEVVLGVGVSLLGGHPIPLVQSAAMAAIPPAAPSYRPLLPACLIPDGLLSDAQIESVVFAG